jgi:hypothetical protein
MFFEENSFPSIEFNYYTITPFPYYIVGIEFFMVRLGASFVVGIWGYFGILNSLFANLGFGHT